MENLKIIYIDDYPETSLSKYLVKYKNSSCNVESLDIKFNPDAGYESLINNSDVKSANIIFIDSKLFENRTAIAGKFTGEEFKIILKKYFPFYIAFLTPTLYNLHEKCPQHSSEMFYYFETINCFPHGGCI